MYNFVYICDISYLLERKIWWTILLMDDLWMWEFENIFGKIFIKWEHRYYYYTCFFYTDNVLAYYISKPKRTFCFDNVRPYMIFLLFRRR